MLPVRNILCPIDFSDSSLEALTIAIELGEHFAATVNVLHVLELLPAPAAIDPLSGAPSVASMHWKEKEANAHQLMTEAVKNHSGSHIALVPLIVNGAAAEQIVQVADKIVADIIVISTHGRTGFRRLVFGSVAEAVMRAAPCPVLTTRPVQAQHPETAE